MSFRRVAGIAGLVFLATLLVNLLASGQPADADASAAEIGEYFADSEGGIKVALAAAALGTVPAIFWAVAAFGRLRAAGGADGDAWALVGLVGFIFAGTSSALCSVVTTALVVGVEGLDDATTVALWRVNWAGTAFLIISSAVLLIGFGYGGLRSRVGAKWSHYVALVGAVAAIVSGFIPTAWVEAEAYTNVGFLGFFAFMIWIAVSSIEMLRLSEGPAAPAEG